MRIIWRKQAEAEFVAILEHIETESKSGAARIRAQVLYSIDFLSEWPLIGREGRRGYRELVVPRTPYVVLYRCYVDEVHVVRVLHGSRRR